MNKAVAGDCPECGGQRERPDQPTCYGCYLDTLIPNGYEEREAYRYDPAWQKLRATRHPKTGVPILDATPTRPSEMGLRPGKLRRPRYD